MEKYFDMKPIDSKGRIVIPRAIREILGLYESDNLKVCIDDNKIILQKCSDMSFLSKQAKMAVSTIKQTYKELSNIICFDKNKIIAFDGCVQNFDASKAFSKLKRENNEMYIKFGTEEYFIVPIYSNEILTYGLAVNVIENSDVNYDIEICVRSTGEFFSNIISC